jgi:hypothetical protein
MAEPYPGVITFTACCAGCKDIFTVWAKVKNGKLFVEPQSRIRYGDGEVRRSYGFVPVPPEGLYHHCGGRLLLYPDLIRSN